MNLGSIKDKSIKQNRKATKITTAITLASLAVIAGVGTISLLTPSKQEEVFQAVKTPAPTHQQAVQAPSEVIPDTPSEDASVSQDAAVVQKMLLPVKEASVLKGYASDSLLYSNTLKHWETHVGIDLAANEGDSVFSVLDGEVISIENDALMGNTVTIEHDNGFKTVYSSLSAISPELKIGMGVLRGEEIGFVGASASSEVLDGAHLHFEVFLNDAPVNPQIYLSSFIK